MKGIFVEWVYSDYLYCWKLSLEIPMIIYVMEILWNGLDYGIWEWISSLMNCVMISEGGIPPLLFVMSKRVTAMVDSIVGLMWIP